MTVYLAGRGEPRAHWSCANYAWPEMLRVIRAARDVVAVPFDTNGWERTDSTPAHGIYEADDCDDLASAIEALGPLVSSRGIVDAQRRIRFVAFLRQCKGFQFL